MTIFCWLVFIFLDRIYRIIWIILFSQFPDETGKTQPAFGGIFLLSPQPGMP
jgi:hypothetical protein